MKSFMILFVFVSLFSLKLYGQDGCKQFLIDINNAKLKYIAKEIKNNTTKTGYINELGIINRSIRNNYYNVLKEDGFTYRFFKSAVFGETSLNKILYVVELYDLDHYASIIYENNGMIYQKTYKVLTNRLNTRKKYSNFNFNYYYSEIDMDCDSFKLTYVSYVSITKVNSDEYKSIIIPYACMSESLFTRIKKLTFPNN